MNSKDYNDEQKNRLAMALVETLEEIQFIRDIADFREGRDDKSIRIPSREERMAMLNRFKEPRVKVSDWLLSKIGLILTRSNLLTGFTPEFADDGENSKTLPTRYKETETNLHVFIHGDNNEIEFYSSNQEFIGKKIVIRNNNDEIVTWFNFEADNTREDMKVVAFGIALNMKDIDVVSSNSNDKSYYWEIVDELPIKTV